MTDRHSLVVEGLTFYFHEIELAPSPKHAGIYTDAPIFFARIAEFINFVAVTSSLASHFSDLLAKATAAHTSTMLQGLHRQFEQQIVGVASELRDSPAWNVFCMARESPDGNSQRIAARDYHSLLEGPSPTPGDRTLVRMADSRYQYFGHVGDFSIAKSALAFIVGLYRDVQKHAGQLLHANWDPIWRNAIEELTATLNSIQDAWMTATDYCGADAASRLARVYFHVNPDSRLLVAPGDLHRTRTLYSAHHHSERMYDVNAYSQAIVDCRKITFTLKHALYSRYAMHRAVERAVHFCEWFAREQLLEYVRQAKNKVEGPLHAFLNEFLFREGYFPIPEPQFGRDRIDTLAEPLQRLLEEAWPVAHDSDVILLEVKQSMSKRISARRFTEWVGQTLRYVTRISTLKPGVAGTGYLLVFYAGSMRYSADVVDIGGFKIVPQFIYLGTTPASKSEPCPLRFQPRQGPLPRPKKRRRTQP